MANASKKKVAAGPVNRQTGGMHVCFYSYQLHERE